MTTIKFKAGDKVFWLTIAFGFMDGFVNEINHKEYIKPDGSISSVTEYWLKNKYHTKKSKGDCIRNSKAIFRTQKSMLKFYGENFK